MAHRVEGGAAAPGVGERPAGRGRPLYVLPARPTAQAPAAHGRVWYYSRRRTMLAAAASREAAPVHVLHPCKPSSVVYDAPGGGPPVQAQMSQRSSVPFSMCFQRDRSRDTARTPQKGAVAPCQPEGRYQSSFDTIHAHLQGAKGLLAQEESETRVRNMVRAGERKRPGKAAFSVEDDCGRRPRVVADPPHDTTDMQPLHDKPFVEGEDWRPITAGAGRARGSAHYGNCGSAATGVVLSDYNWFSGTAIPSSGVSDHRPLTAGKDSSESNLASSVVSSTSGAQPLCTEALVSAGVVPQPPPPYQGCSPRRSASGSHGHVTRRATSVEGPLVASFLWGSDEARGSGPTSRRASSAISNNNEYDVVDAEGAMGGTCSAGKSVGHHDVAVQVGETISFVSGVSHEARVCDGGKEVTGADAISDSEATVPVSTTSTSSSSSNPSEIGGVQVVEMTGPMRASQRVAELVVVKEHMEEVPSIVTANPTAVGPHPDIHSNSSPTSSEDRDAKARSVSHHEGGAYYSPQEEEEERARLVTSGNLSPNPSSGMDSAKEQAHEKSSMGAAALSTSHSIHSLRHECVPHMVLVPVLGDDVNTSSTDGSRPGSVRWEWMEEIPMMKNGSAHSLHTVEAQASQPRQQPVGRRTVDSRAPQAPARPLLRTGDVSVAFTPQPPPEIVAPFNPHKHNEDGDSDAADSAITTTTTSLVRQPAETTTLLPRMLSEVSDNITDASVFPELEAAPPRSLHEGRRVVIQSPHAVLPAVAESTPSLPLPSHYCVLTNYPSLIAGALRRSLQTCDLQSINDTSTTTSTVMKTYRSAHSSSLRSAPFADWGQLGGFSTTPSSSRQWQRNSHLPGTFHAAMMRKQRELISSSIHKGGH